VSAGEKRHLGISEEEKTRIQGKEGIEKGGKEKLNLCFSMFIRKSRMITLGQPKSEGNQNSYEKLFLKWF